MLFNVSVNYPRGTTFIKGVFSKMSSHSNLIIVSNRLPITIKKLESRNYECSQSTGGLAGALSGLTKSMPFRWFGWPGLGIPREDEELVTQKVAEYNVLPIFLDNALADKYYNGFSSQFPLLYRLFEQIVRCWTLCDCINHIHACVDISCIDSTLWPLFHYQLHEMSRIDKAAWDAYYDVNLLFAKVIIPELHDGDTVWIHDYHLMLLPQFLRESTRQSGIEVKIGFFLHTPFPSSEVYRILPMRKKILTGLLHCDLVGFHTISYARHFLNSCSEILWVAAASTNAINSL